MFQLAASYLLTRTARPVFSSAMPKSTLYSTSTSLAMSTAIVDQSTLTLLEHINLNIPNHDHIDFYYKVLGCGMDPRKAANLKPNALKKTLWANAGASQFHLPYGQVGQRIPGHVGLFFDSLEGLKKRVAEHIDCYAHVEEGSDQATGRDFVRLTDHYGNIFVCRAKDAEAPSSLRQPIISPSDAEEWGDIATTYGREETECRGIHYVEFQCPPGSASKIASFYDSLLDATTNVVTTAEGSAMAIVGIGNIDESGRSTQSLLFRETSEGIPPYDGHHIALYVGQNAADFEQAFRNALIAGVVWKNPRFSDQVDSLEEAQKEQQFRFKDIIDIESGERIMELEHEMRSVDHPSWPQLDKK